MAGKPLDINIIEFFEHPAILGIDFLSATQKVTLKAIYGIPLDAETPIPKQHEFQSQEGFENEIELFKFLTGKTEYIPGLRYTDITLCWGRRSGKSTLIGAGISLFQATQFDYKPYLKTSPHATIPIISPTQKQAGEVYDSIKQMILKSPYLFNEFMDGDIDGFQEEYLEKDIGDTTKITGKIIQLNNKVVIKVLTADVSVVRGFAAPFYIMDECAWFGVEGNDTKNTDKGIFEALQPTTMQFGDLAFGLKISSPNGQSGMMYEDHLNEKDPDVLHIKAPSWYANISVSKSYLNKQKKKGKGYFSREYGANYESSEHSYLDPNKIDECVLRGVESLDYNKEYLYAAAMDYATKGDYWTFGIGHKEYIFDAEEKVKKEKIYIDFLVSWKGRQGAELDPDAVIAEISNYMKGYGVPFCLSDQYAFAAVRSIFHKYGAQVKEFVTSSKSKLKYMYSLQVAINSGTLAMVNNSLAIKHLKDLREKRTASNQLKVEHAANSHDDFADVIALICYQFDKSSPIYIGAHKADQDPVLPQNKDAKGNYIATPTAMDVAEKMKIDDKFELNVGDINDINCPKCGHKNQFYIKAHEKVVKCNACREQITLNPEEDDNNGSFWFTF